MSYEISKRSKIESFRIRDVVKNFSRIGLVIISALLSLNVYYIVGKAINVNRNKNVFLSNVIEVVSSRNELENILSEEKEKLGLEHIDIDLKITDKVEVAETTFFRNPNKRNYFLNINPETKSRFAVRHELYHISCVESYGILRCLGSIEEWMATSYAIKETN